METPMPRDLTEQAVAEWLGCVYSEAGMYVGPRGAEGRLAMARAVLALVEAKVREGLAEYRRLLDTDCDYDDEIVARVMGKEAPRA